MYSKKLLALSLAHNCSTFQIVFFKVSLGLFLTNFNASE